MSQPKKPESMSASEWRLWCCCRPTVTPPPHENFSLDEFDPENRLSMSRAYAQHNRSPHPPSTSPKGHESSQEVRHPEPTKTRPHQSAHAHPEYKAPQRPSTILLPNLPERPVRTPETKVRSEHPNKATFVRQDSEAGEKWWQVGRRRMERREKSSSPKRDDSEGSERK